MTGTINNEGTIENVTFIGAELTGGTLSGNIINASQVSGIIKDVYLIAGTVLQSGKVAGTITGDPTDKPVITGVTIMPGTILTNVHLSPTVTISENVVLGEGVTIATEPYTPADFGLDDEDIASLTSEWFSEIEPEALATFNSKHVSSVPAEAFSSISTKQMSQIRGLEGLTKEQFAQIPIKSFHGLTSENMGDLPVEVIQEFTPEHIEILNEPEFEAMESEDISKLFVNLDFADINLITHLVPKDWKLNVTTGELTAPFGS
ncbi:MAG: hypothetical protein IMF12_06985, partial [Proteobacteria bacterium]|nr:hypothetical protein [Pseudomonadota bacterium]